MSQPLQIGTIIRYHLHAEERPTHPEKMWMGEIVSFVDNLRTSQTIGYYVKSLEPGYENEEDFVWCDQIVSGEM